MQKENKFTLKIEPAKAGNELVEIRYIRGLENNWLTNLLKKDRDTQAVIESIKGRKGDYLNQPSFLGKLAIKFIWGGKNPMLHGCIGEGGEVEGKITIYTFIDKRKNECIWLEAKRSSNRQTPLVACTLESTLMLLEELKCITMHE